MKLIRNIKTNDVYTEEQFKERYQNILGMMKGIPDDVIQLLNCEYVIETVVPNYTFKQELIIKNPVENKDGLYEASYEVRNLTNDEFVIKLQNARDTQWAKVKAERARLYLDGMFVQGKWFETDTTSLLKYLSMASSGDMLPTDIEWKTMDNSFITITPALAKELHATAIVSNNAIFQTGETIYSMIKESEDPLSIDITDGWPVTYSSKK